MTALYLHVPFCRSKCSYCSFISIPACGDLFLPYVEALRREIASLGESCPSPLSSLFIGGGTPTVLPFDLLVGIIVHCRDVLKFSPEVEVTLEANPGTVTKEALKALCRSGVNRISLGVQSLDNDDLKILGRFHSSREATAAVVVAREAGFANISLDLMSGLPGQTPSSWQRTLDGALALQPEHLSIYQLTIEEGTPFAGFLERGRLVLPEEDEILEMDRRTMQTCAAAGLQQYEISNYARPGFQCRHNLNYWQNGEYFACGASAVSYIGGIREKRTEDVREYIKMIAADQSAIVERETLALEASFRETVIMGLRLVRGVSREGLRNRYGLEIEDYYGQTLKKLCQLGLVELSDSHLRLSERGRRLANRVMAELV